MLTPRSVSVFRGERLPEVPSEGMPFLSDFLQLNRRVAAMVAKIRNSAFWFYDSLVEPYVRWCYWWYWDEVEGLLNGKPRFPTLDADAVKGWERTFRQKRRHLIWLFQTAVRLEEEVTYSTI